MEDFAEYKAQARADLTRDLRESKFDNWLSFYLTRIG